MLDRESTFADPEILQMLRDQFVPVAIDQWYTRRQQVTEGDFYRKIAGQSPRNDFSRTTQGLYIADPAGRLYFYNNNRGPDRIRRFMRETLAAYQAPDVEPLQRESTDARYVTQPSEGTAVVRSSARIPEGYLTTDDLWQKIFQTAISRDNLWITPDEQTELLADRVPERLIRRIARFHLVDNTRGQPDSWALEEIQSLEMTIVDGRISGRVVLESKDGKRGYDVTLEGIVSGTTGRVERFDLLAVGKFFGSGQYTLQAPPGRFPLEISFQLVDGSDTADRIPPHASRGWLDGYLYPER
ncbi:MAG TPA: hypothetical protein PKD64_12595 [Pirellulaceae bacterium]|nr:hypothetical protein [Pirellulaceae bacterium]